MFKFIHFSLSLKQSHIFSESHVICSPSLLAGGTSVLRGGADAERCHGQWLIPDTSFFNSNTISDAFHRQWNIVMLMFLTIDSPQTEKNTK